MYAFAGLLILIFLCIMKKILQLKLLLYPPFYCLYPMYNYVLYDSFVVVIIIIIINIQTSAVMQII